MNYMHEAVIKYRKANITLNTGSRMQHCDQMNGSIVQSRIHDDLSVRIRWEELSMIQIEIIKRCLLDHLRFSGFIIINH